MPKFVINKNPKDEKDFITNFSLFFGGKVVNRNTIDPTSNLAKNIDATAAIIPKRSLKQNGSYFEIYISETIEFKFNKRKTRHQDYATTTLDLGSFPMLNNMYSIVKGGAVVIDKNKMATAAHCIRTNKDKFENTEDHDDYRELKLIEDKYFIVFDYFFDGDDFRIRKIPISKVFEIDAITKFNHFGNLYDYAEFTVKPFDGKSILPTAPPITVPASADKVYMLGFPLGCPMVMTIPADIVQLKKIPLPPATPAKLISFTTNLEAFNGNSGCPVFNSASNELLGIMNRGSTEFYFDKPNKKIKLIDPNYHTEKIQVIGV